MIIIKCILSLFRWHIEIEQRVRPSSYYTPQYRNFSVGDIVAAKRNYSFEEGIIIFVLILIYSVMMKKYQLNLKIPLKNLMLIQMIFMIIV